MRRTPLTRRTPLKARSAKTERIYRTQRRPLVQRLLAPQPACQRCHTAQAVDVHELTSRARGGSIVDLDNLALLCRACHDWITTHPADATATGWMRPTVPSTSKQPPRPTSPPHDPPDG